MVSRLGDITIHNIALEEKLKVLMQSSISEEDKAAQMDQFFTDEELAMKVSRPTKKGFFVSIFLRCFSHLYLSG